MWITRTSDAVMSRTVIQALVYSSVSKPFLDNAPCWETGLQLQKGPPTGGIINDVVIISLKLGGMSSFLSSLKVRTKISYGSG